MGHSYEERCRLRIQNSPTFRGAPDLTPTHLVDPQIVREDGTPGGTVQPPPATSCFGEQGSFDPRWSYWRALRWVLYGFVLHVGISFLRYALAHPELTDTQRLLDFWKVITWQ